MDLLYKNILMHALMFHHIESLALKMYVYVRNVQNNFLFT